MPLVLRISALVESFVTDIDTTKQLQTSREAIRNKEANSSLFVI